MMKQIVEEEYLLVCDSLKEAKEQHLTESVLILTAKQLVLEELMNKYETRTKQSEVLSSDIIEVTKELSKEELRKIDLYLNGMITENELKGD